MTITDAISVVQAFKSDSLADQIAAIESDLARIRSEDIAAVTQPFGINHELLLAAAAVKQASAQIDVVIHSVGILYALPHLLRKGEVVEGLSLGAGSAGSDFDLVTSQRIAEFKFIRWQAKRNAIRNKTVFQDFFKLAREETAREKYLYLLNTEIPLRFLQGGRDLPKVLDRNKRLAEDFTARYGRTYRTVGEYYKAHQDEVHIVNLTEMVPGFDEFMAIFR